MLPTSKLTKRYFLHNVHDLLLEGHDLQLEGHDLLLEGHAFRMLQRLFQLKYGSNYENRFNEW